MSSLRVKPHVVCVPFPAQGHINPMMKLAQLPHFRAFHFTFVNTEFNHHRLLKSGGLDSLRGLHDFQFETIPDGLPPSDLNATQDIPALCNSTSKKCLVPFRNLVKKLNDTVNVPPVTWIISDGIMTFTLQVAKEFRIPDVLLWTSSASSFQCFRHCRQIVQRVLTPFKDERTDEYLNNRIDWINGIKDIRLKDLPSFMQTTDPNDMMFNFSRQEAERASEASAIIFHTFQELDQEVLDAISSTLPHIYSVGPLPFLLNQITESCTRIMGSNLWKVEKECLKWLDRKEPGSVIYINFGSISVMTAQELSEFAWGLANSNHPFLWIVRPDLVRGESAMLPQDFVESTLERGLLVGWCPQEEVLSHPSVGGFLTHCGWNSILESISAGVPVLCWPVFADQLTNCRFSCSEWGIGMEIDSNAKRDEVERLVRELMEGNKGKVMKQRAMEWKQRAVNAAKEGVGSSYLNLEKLVNEVLLPAKID